MKNSTPAPKAEATTNQDVLLTLLQRASEARETFDYVHRELARLTIDAGATYQQAGDAMSRDRSTAHTYINGRAA